MSSRAQDQREHKPEDAQAQQRETQPNQAPPLPITITGPVRVEREKEPEPDWNKLKCDETKSHEEADLCEQRRMAKAAERTVQLNWAQIIVGAAGFLALLYSLHLNRTATNFAGKAAQASEQSVAAAIRAADAAERSLQTNRAWLCFLEIGVGTITDSHVNEILIKKGRTFWFDFKNAGLTPALGARAFVCHKVAPHGASVPIFPDQSPDPQLAANIAPSQIFSSGTIFLHDEDTRRWLAHEVVVYLYCRIIYFDVHHETIERETTVCMRAIYHGPKMLDGRQTDNISVQPVGAQQAMT